MDRGVGVVVAVTGGGCVVVGKASATRAVMTTTAAEAAYGLEDRGHGGEKHTQGFGRDGLARG
jgi:hypothetical protein